jgi:sugar lactone lactonase YvrE
VPAIVSLSGDVVYVMDSDGRLFRYDGDRRRELLIKDRKFTAPVDVAVFSLNIYVLDAASGQVWKYEPSADGQYSSPAIGFLDKPLPPGAVRSLAVDGDVWIVTNDGKLHRFHRQSGQTASELDAGIRWHGEAVHIDAVQAKEGQGRRLWLLDAAARRVVQIAKDGVEEARIALPAELPNASAFVVVEEGGYVVTLHGTRLARTDLPR